MPTKFILSCCCCWCNYCYCGCCCFVVVVSCGGAFGCLVYFNCLDSLIVEIFKLVCWELSSAIWVSRWFSLSLPFSLSLSLTRCMCVFVCVWGLNFATYCMCIILMYVVCVCVWVSWPLLAIKLHWTAPKNRILCSTYIQPSLTVKDVFSPKSSQAGFRI